MAITIPRNRVFTEAGKNIDALRAESVVVSAPGAATVYAVAGPFSVDVDVASIHTTIANTSANLTSIDVYNNSHTTNSIIAQVTTLTADTPAGQPITGNQRVKAGTPIVVKLIASGVMTTTVRICYEIPIDDPTANTTLSGAYNSGTQD